MFELKTTFIEYADGTVIPCLREANLKNVCRDVYEVSLNVPYGNKSVRKIKYVFDVQADFEYAMVHDFFDSGFKSVKNLEEDTRSKFYMSLMDKNGVGITFAVKLPCKFYSEMHYFRDKNEMVLETVVPFSYKGDIPAETFIIACGMTHGDALRLIAEKNGTPQKWENVIGWGSWDYYFTSVTEDDVKENTDFIYADDTLRERIKYIAIDDGWQQREGDWREGIRFPGGLKKTTEYINSKGYTAGIWTAPTRLHYLCGTVMRRNDFLVLDEYGDPIMDEEFYVLDPTHPEGEKFVKEIFSYLKDAGFGFYKIDFISNLLKCDRFHDSTAGHYDALKKLISAIRESVGEESHIMGCSLPYGYGGDGVNSRRTGLDIHNTWNHIVKCSEIYYPAIPAQRNIYQNDMDYLVVRGPETSFERDTNVLNPKKGYYKAVKSEKFRWREGEDFNYNEAKFWCTQILMTGSSVILSDKLSLLNDKGLKLAKTTVKYADFYASVPVDTGAELPQVWFKKGADALYIFNFTEQDKTYNIDVMKIFGRDVKLTDIFENAEYTSRNGTLSLTLRKHCSLALYL
ncbi:MAG: hypothetical protein E7588_03200 [Ruminococcaceae bacterium]|nr:hypothetical protein [Oscillospiraceae bacterium]